MKVKCCEIESQQHSLTLLNKNGNRSPIFNTSLFKTQFNNFKRADVYSMALVMWEVLNRTQITSDYKCQPYRLPYYEHYSNDPSLEQMHDIIVVYKHRPDAEFDDFICKLKAYFSSI